MNLDYPAFLQTILDLISKFGINVSDSEMDHMGYQCSSDEDYDNFLPKFKFLGKLLSEEIVGARRVAIIELDEKIIFNQYVISAIELIAPKPTQVCESGLEHVEFILKESFESFLNKYPNIEFITSEINQKDFPMIKLKLNDKYQVKFHLENVIDIVRRKLNIN